MADEPLGPDYLTTRGIPTSRRGYDKRVVEALFSEARNQWQALVDEHRELRDAVDATGGIEFLTRDLSAVGKEVGEVLEAAQRAAEGMRVRSREEAETMEREAAEQAAAMVAEAEQQAYDLRGNAWEGGMDLIDSTLLEAERLVQAAKDDALVIRAQAEKDAHRHISGAEREASNLIRQARYESDRQLNQARELAQQIIDRASVPHYDDPAQPGTPAVDGRDQVLEEIERIQLEQSIDSVSVFQNEPRLPEPGQGPPTDPDGIELSDVVAADVHELRTTADDDDLPTPTREPEVIRLSTAQPEPEPFGNPDDVGTLFEALRTTGETEPVLAEEQLPADPFELRDQLLIPVVNDGARDTKRRIVDLQNGALAGLRGSGWDPDPPSVGRELGLALEPMILKAASAGARAAGPLADLRGSVADPGERSSQLVGSMAAALSGQLAAALEDSGGPEEQAEAVSRVFRTWRNDDADRWVRMIGTAAYHDSLISALRNGGVDSVQSIVGAGPTCDDCPAPQAHTWRPGRQPPEGTQVPPTTVMCGCTVVPVA